MEKCEKNKRNDLSPKVYINQITFNDNTCLSLNHNSIVVFTGANNCGKSQVLRDIEGQIDDSNHQAPIVLHNLTCEYVGSIEEETFFNKHFSHNDRGIYSFAGADSLFTKESLISHWNNHELQLGLNKLFCKRLDTTERLTISDPLVRSPEAEIHPLFKLLKSEALAQKISDYFHKAFGMDLLVNRNNMSHLPLHVGIAPDKSKYTIDKQDDYYMQVDDMPLLHMQGDGMRSFTSILLDAFTSDYCITLIDEPEAFLHPPQARLLGRLLVENQGEEKQLFIATHSEDFLQGLLDTDSENVTVIRIDRVQSKNKICILNNHKIKELWRNPILRYSSILSGLFHQKVAVCESDYDCLFYQAVIDSIYESKNQLAPDMLFTYCGGKNRMKDVTASLSVLNVPVVAICDFDILDDKQSFKSITNSIGIDWEAEIADNMKIIYDSMNAKNCSGKNAWNDIKRIGKAGFTGDEPSAYEKVEKICKSHGLFIVPVGEMECFDKTINKQKKEWVYSVLQKYDLSNEEKLRGAREFVQEIVDFR